MATKENHKSTQRVLDVLLLLSKEQKALTLTEISKNLSIPPSTLVPILYTLTAQGFLTLAEETNRYSIGLMNYVIGNSYFKNHDPLVLLNDRMRQLAKQVNETCQLGVLRGNEVLYIGKAEENKIRLISDIGKLLPAHCTAMGKCLLSDMTYQQVKELLPAELVSVTPNTITDLDTLYQQLEETRKTGIAYDLEETLEDVSCVAIPIREHGKITYSVSVSTPSFRFTEEKKQLIIDSLLAMKEEIELVTG